MLNAHSPSRRAAEESVNPLVPALPDLVWGTLAFVIILALLLLEGACRA